MSMVGTEVEPHISEQENKCVNQNLQVPAWNLIILKKEHFSNYDTDCTIFENFILTEIGSEVAPVFPAFPLLHPWYEGTPMWTPVLL